MSSENFGRYTIKTEIGRGGMATVILAYDPRFERDVAIKVLPREFLHDTQFRTRFEREAKTIALLEHPAIVPVYDFGEEEGQPFIVMRFMSGGSLADHLKKGAIPLHEVIQIFSRLAPALDAAHARGITHRDLKPGNILFDQYGNAFLSDFGIARLAQASSVTLTGGNILGTPAYMSPEQVQGDREIDGRSDVYAMGVILYQLLSGNAPYQSTTPARVMMMHILEPVPNIINANPDLPAGIQAVIERAMAKEPEERFQSMSEMANALAATITQPITPAPALRSADDATMVATGKTDVRPVRQQVQKTVAAPRITPTGEEKKRPIAPFLFAGVLFIFLLSAVAGGGFIYFQNNAKNKATQAAAALVDINPMPTETLEPTTFPTDTPPVEPEETEAVLVADQATNTPESASTDTPEPSPTSTAEPQAPILGGADKIAFISNREVWLANLDGSELTRLTNDGAGKIRLQWLADGNTLLYIQGKCVKTVDIQGRVEVITCFDTAAYFEDFAVSPDGSQVAISIDHEYLFIVPFDKEKLSQVRFRRDLVPLGTCQFFAPYGPMQFKDVHWSKDGKLLAMVIGAPVGGRINDIIEVRDFSACAEIPRRVGVQFPANYFTIKGYNSQPYIQNFGWDGQALFAMTGIIRNGGFGDLYIYNSDNNRAELEINPIGGDCCYRDPSWSPDGTYMAFAFQAVSQINKIEVFVVRYGDIGTGQAFQPLALPEDMFPNRDENPQPVLRPVQSP
jgi:hypothetical protein